MGYCTNKYFFITTCFIQILFVTERQFFDFMAFLWIPILVNFFEIIFIIFGIFGSCQHRTKYILSYLLWHLFWIFWNIFIICSYLDVPGLDHKTNPVLNIDGKSSSWWYTNGPGCKSTLKPESEPIGEVQNCLFNYQHVELFQAGIQIFLTITGITCGSCLGQKYLRDNKSPIKSQSKSSKRTSLYSIEFSSEVEDGREDLDKIPQPVSPKPMTPRRVKRRSVMTRGSTTRHSSSSRRSNTARSSVRSTRSSRRTAQNPVTRLIDRQATNAVNNSDTSLADYYNSSSSSFIQNRSTFGHTNPTYQKSSMQSLNENEVFDDIYNNRPASVRSSYSNFHGTRALNYSPPKHYHSHATPQVPQKRNQPNRNSMRSMTFLTNGPPAYALQGVAVSPGDSETTI